MAAVERPLPRPRSFCRLISDKLHVTIIPLGESDNSTNARGANTASGRCVEGTSPMGRKARTMARKMYVEVKVRLIIEADDGVDLQEVMSEMDYNFTSTTDGASVSDSEIRDFTVTDSK